MLAKRYRLRKDFQFRYVYRKGSFVRTPAVNLVFVKARHKGVKVGISVSNKVGNAVLRNRVKRRIRECVAEILPEVRTGYNYILVANSGYNFAEAIYSDIHDCVRQALNKAGMLGATCER